MAVITQLTQNGNSAKTYIKYVILTYSYELTLHEKVVGHVILLQNVSSIPSLVIDMGNKPTQIGWDFFCCSAFHNNPLTRNWDFPFRKKTGIGRKRFGGRIPKN